MIQTLKQINDILLKIAPKNLRDVDSLQANPQQALLGSLRLKLKAIIQQEQTMAQTEENIKKNKQIKLRNQIKCLKVNLQKSNFLQDQYLKAYIAEKKMNQFLIRQLQSRNINQNEVIMERMSQYRDSMQNSEKIIQSEMEKIQQIKIQIASVYYQTKHIVQQCTHCQKINQQQYLIQFQKIINKIVQPELQEKIIKDLSLNCNMQCQKSLENSKNDIRSSKSNSPTLSYTLKESTVSQEIFELVYEIGSKFPLGESENSMFCPQNQKQCVQLLKQIEQFSNNYESQFRQMEIKKQQWEQNMMQILQVMINTHEIQKNFIFQLFDRSPEFTHLKNLMHKFYFQKQIREFSKTESIWTFGKSKQSDREFSH